MMGKDELRTTVSSQDQRRAKDAVRRAREIAGVGWGLLGPARQGALIEAARLVSAQ